MHPKHSSIEPSKSLFLNTCHILENKIRSSTQSSKKKLRIEDNEKESVKIAFPQSLNFCVSVTPFSFYFLFALSVVNKREMKDQMCP